MGQPMALRVGPLPQTAPPTPCPLRYGARCPVFCRASASCLGPQHLAPPLHQPCLPPLLASPLLQHLLPWPPQLALGLGMQAQLQAQPAVVEQWGPQMQGPALVAQPNCSPVS